MPNASILGIHDLDTRQVSTPKETKQFPFNHSILWENSGAGEGTRTPTPKAPEPKSGASTNSATPASDGHIAEDFRQRERVS